MNDDMPTWVTSRRWKVALGGATVAALCSACAGAPSLRQGLETGSITPVATAPAPQPTVQTAPPQQAEAPAKPTGLAVLNPLPALGQMAQALSNSAAQAAAPQAVTPVADSVPMSRVASGRMTEERTVAGKPMAIYETLARGVHACFMGGRGPLRGYMFQGEAKPEAKGGGAEIAIHEKDQTQQFPRGLMAFRIAIEPSAGETVKIEVSSIRVPTDLGAAMRADVLAWAQGQTTQCQAQVVRPPPPIPVAAPAPKAKKKPVAKKQPSPQPAAVQPQSKS